MFKYLRREIMGKGMTDLREILDTPKWARKAASFMIRTELLGQYGAISENDMYIKGRALSFFGYVST